MSNTLPPGDGRPKCARCGWLLVIAAPGRPRLCWLCGVKEDRLRAFGEKLRDRIDAGRKP